MDFKDFSIKDKNGQTENLKEVKHGIRKEMLAEKYHLMFETFDKNKNGTFEQEDLNLVLNKLSQYSKYSTDDNILDFNENIYANSVFMNDYKIQEADFMGFVKSVSDASEKIETSEEIPISNNGKKIITKYKDGTIETIAYYPNGEYMYKKLEKEGIATINYTIGNQTDKYYTQKEINDKVDEAFNKQYSKNTQLEIQTSGLNYYKLKEDFRKEYLQQHNIKRNNDAYNYRIEEYQFSEKGKADVKYALRHYVDTYSQVKEALETMGVIDNLGALINSSFGDSGEILKSIFKDSQEDYKNFYNLSKNFENNYTKYMTEKGHLEELENHPETYYKNFTTEFNLDEFNKFKQISTQYQDAQALKERISLLDKAIKEIRDYDLEKKDIYSKMPEDVNTAPSHLQNATNLLMKYFNNDRESLNLLLGNVLNEKPEITIQFLLELKTYTQNLNKAILGNKTFEQVQKEYKNEYKSTFGTNFVPEDLNEKINNAKLTGNMTKLGIITIVSIIITKSPAMANVTGATGDATALINQLVSKFGAKTVEQGIKLAITTGTLATNEVLTLFNQITSKRGINEEELIQDTKSSAGYIFLGAYIGGPLSKVLSESLSTSLQAGKLFESGAKAVTGTIQTTTVTGSKFLGNLKKIIPPSAGFLTELSIFTGYDIIVDGETFIDAVSEQGKMLSKLKLMNHILAYLMGSLTHKAVSDPKIIAENKLLKEAIDKTGIDKLEIKEIKTPEKTEYEVQLAGTKIGTFENNEQITIALTEKIATNYEILKQKQDISNTPSQEVSQDSRINLSKFYDILMQKGISGTVYITPDNRRLVELQVETGRYDYYEFDSNNNIVNIACNLTKDNFTYNYADFIISEQKKCGYISGKLFVGIPLNDLPSKGDMKNAKSLREEVSITSDKNFDKPFVTEKDITDFQNKYSTHKDIVMIAALARTYGIKPVERILKGRNYTELKDILYLTQIFDAESVYRLAELNTKEGFSLLSQNDIKKLLTTARDQNSTNLVDKFINTHNKFININRENYKENNLLKAFLINPEFVERTEVNPNLNATDLLQILEITNNHKANIEDVILTLEYKNEKGEYRNIEDFYTMIVVMTNLPQVSFFEMVKTSKNPNGLEISEIKDICVNQIRIQDENDQGVNNYKNDAKRIERYSQIFNNPKLRDWAIENIKAGFKMDEIVAMVQTKQTYHSTEQKSIPIIDANTKPFIDLGLNGTNAQQIVKAITDNGIKNPKMEEAAFLLINSGYDKSKIADVLNCAKLSGQFNEKIVSDALLIKDIEMNPLLKKYLPALNNLESADIYTKFSSNLTNQLITILDKIDPEIQLKLINSGFKIFAINKKLKTKSPQRPTNSERINRPENFRTKAALNSYEKIIIEKYKPEEKIWRNENSCKQWAEEKYLAMKQGNYDSKRAGDFINTEEVNRQRKESLKEWFNFMDNNSMLNENPFAKIVITEFITKDLKADNSYTPPNLNKDIVKEILGNTLNTNSEFSFAKMYTEKLNSNLKNKENKRDVTINGRHMSWYTIPKTLFGEDNFKEIVAEIKTLSDGTNWCLRTWKADVYIQEGNLNFLVDENGMAQVCIRELGKNSIHEIEKRQESGELPVQYIDFIEEFINQGDYHVPNETKIKINEAKNNKPIYEKIKTEFTQYVERNDYKGLLEKMGITVKVLPDGTWELSHYKSYIKLKLSGDNQICLNDLNIDENKLLENVSIIKGDADFRDSNINKLPKLKEIGGVLRAEYTNITNIQNLEKVNGKTIIWE